MNANPLPGQQEQPPEILCPSCGHFVGALTRCPHCGARVTKRMSIRFFRYAALALGTVGLGLLYLMAIHREIPIIQIGNIRPMMNFAYVRIAGTVTGDARLFKEGDKVRTLRFMVDDGSGELMVTAYRAQAEALVAADRVPRVGDRVEVAGSLGVAADDNVVMRLQVPEHLFITRAEMPVTALADIGVGMVGTAVVVEGTISKVIAPRPQSRAPWTVLITDASGGEQPLTFWQSTYDEIRDKILLVPGTPVRARVGVATYRDKLQLSLGRGTDLEFPKAGSARQMTAGPGAPESSAPAADAVAIGDVTADMAGHTVQVSGKVAAIKEPAAGSKAPYDVTLQDGEKTISVIYWDTVAQRLEANKPVVGAALKAVGVVNVYKGKLQVKVNRADQLTVTDVVSPAATASGASATPAEEMKISAVTRSMVKKTCTLRGSIGEAKSIRGGATYTLSDSTGTIKLVLWDKNVPGPDRDPLTAGAKVKVTGEIVDFKGALEIVPPNAQSVQVESAPAK